MDAMGLNVHFAMSSQVYQAEPSAQLGIRHFRTNVKPNSPGELSRLTYLHANHGIQMLLVCDSTAWTPVQYRDLMKSPMFESVEGLNEPDVFGPRSYQGQTDTRVPQSYPATTLFQQELHAAMKSDAATAAKPVLSPAMANPANSHYLRPVAADAIALHSYPGLEMPTANFFTSYALPVAQLMATPGAGVPRLLVTETGYRSGSAPSEISQLAAAKYIPRTYAEYFRLGVAQNYVFEMTDIPGTYNYGLLNSAFAPKPAYTALKNLIGLLGEAGWNSSQQVWIPPAFTPGVLDYTLSGATPNLHHVLLQKSTGVFYLLLWQEVSSYDPTTRTDLTNPTVPVSLTFNLPLASAALYQLQSSTPVATFSSPRSITVNVPDEVVVLQLTPGGTPATTAPVVALTATTAGAVFAPYQQGIFTVTRTGSTAAPLTVAYTTRGSATPGVDYTALTGTVLIPAGLASANILVVPANVLAMGRKEVALTLTSSSAYRTAPRSSAIVYLNASRTMVADFETGAPGVPGWTGSNWSAVSRDGANADSGTGALKWVFNDNGIDRWGNDINLTFAAAQDWSAVSRIELRIKESAANPVTDITQPVYFTWFNNGARVDGGPGVDRFPLAREAGYRTVSVDLRGLPRDRLTGLMFYVDGKMLQTGQHVFYLDNITAVTDTHGVLDDLEQNAARDWTGSARSQIEASSQHADTGQFGLKWLYTDDGVSRWGNSINLNFPQAHDLTRYSTLCLRFKEDAANPGSAIGKRVYLDWINNGVRASSGTGVTSFPLKGSAGYRTIELSLNQLKRDKVSSVYFYVDGNALGLGPHAWYLDNVTVY